MIRAIRGCNAQPPGSANLFRAIDLAVMGHKTIHCPLPPGSRQTKLDMALVEKLLLHGVNVELVRLKSSGRNTLDFALVYYLGHARHLGKQTSEIEVWELIEMMGQAGHLASDDKGVLTYHPDRALTNHNESSEGEELDALM